MRHELVEPVELVEPAIVETTMAVSESEDEIVIEGEGIEGEGLSETLRGTRIHTHTLCTAKSTVWKTSRQPSAKRDPV